jgi:hypothetical protein
MFFNGYIFRAANFGLKVGGLTCYRFSDTGKILAVVGRVGSPIDTPAVFLSVIYHNSRLAV